jgi:hypothetical protein
MLFIYVAAQKPEVYKCADCKYQTFRKADLKKHLKRHMGVCNYCCNYCSRTFFDKYNLERHINANHTKKQKYSCKTVMSTIGTIIGVYFLLFKLFCAQLPIHCWYSSLSHTYIHVVCLIYSVNTQRTCMIHLNAMKNWNTVIILNQNLSVLFVTMWVLPNMTCPYICSSTTSASLTCKYLVNFYVL